MLCMCSDLVENMTNLFLTRAGFGISDGVFDPTPVWLLDIPTSAKPRFYGTKSWKNANNLRFLSFK